MLQNCSALSIFDMIPCPSLPRACAGRGLLFEELGYGASSPMSPLACGWLVNFSCYAERGGAPRRHPAPTGAAAAFERSGCEPERLSAAQVCACQLGWSRLIDGGSGAQPRWLRRAAAVCAVAVASRQRLFSRAARGLVSYKTSGKT